MTPPVPNKRTLPLTLAERVRTLREELDLTQRQLARKSQMPLTQVEEIESGVDLFLSPSVRLKLCRALRVAPGVLQEVEKRMPEELEGDWRAFNTDEGYLLRQIVMKPDAVYTCPRCQAPLVVREFNRRDLDENSIRVVKVHCSQCLFQMASE